MNDPSKRFDLTGRVAIVTGGSRGLGREISLALAQHGANVVVASRKVDACIAWADELSKATGCEAMGAEFHAGVWDHGDRLFDQVLERFGKVDVLVNNAGMSPLYGSLDEVSMALFDKVVDVNLKGPFRLSVLAGDWMSQHDGGSIINVGSTSSLQPKPNQLVYAGAKAALTALTMGLARAYAPDVRCNLLMPGPFLTDISKSWDLEAFTAEAQRSIAMKRAGDPHEIAGAAVYLASDASSFTTGSVLKVDGGAVWAPA